MPKKRITWLDTSEKDGLFLFTFDGKTVFNLFQDYPDKLTEEQRKIFDEEEPYWKNYFQDRTQ